MEPLELATRAVDVDCPVCGRNEVIKYDGNLACNLCGASSADPAAGFPKQRTSPKPSGSTRKPASSSRTRKPAAKSTTAKRSRTSSAKSTTATKAKGGTT